MTIHHNGRAGGDYRMYDLTSLLGRTQRRPLDVDLPEAVEEERFAAYWEMSESDRELYFDIPTRH